VVCTRALEFVNLVYSPKTFPICGAVCLALDGIGLLGDEFRDVAGGGGEFPSKEQNQKGATHAMANSTHLRA
jgi:hypothetical protein